MALSTERWSESFRKLAFGWLLVAATLFYDGAIAQQDETVIPNIASVNIALRGDDIGTTNQPFELDTLQDQMLIFPTIDPASDMTLAPTTEETTEAADAVMDELVLPTGPAVVLVFLSEEPLADETASPNPQPSTGDGDTNVGPKPLSDVVCVTKDAVQDKDAVSLTLGGPSNCEDTRQKIQSVLEHLCGEDCKLEVYQENNSNEILITGPYVQADAQGMAEKFNNDNIKDKMDVKEAVPRWVKNSKAVLIALLVTGLLLALLLLAVYYMKTHRGKSAKGVRLAESYQVDEENQANTLVSVAPLHPQEALVKAAVNGEFSAAENGAGWQLPATYGTSAPQNPVADTQM